jgi:hypothetical protein
MTTMSNKPAAPNAGIASRLAIKHHWPGVGDPERSASMRTSAFLFILLLLNAGCFFGDRVPEQRAVALSLSAPQSQSATGLSVDSAQTQEALKLIDAELVAQGFVRDEKPEGASGQGLVASYGRPKQEGTEVAVLYDPENPSVAFISKDYYFGPNVCLGIGVTFVLMGSWFAYLVFTG